MPFESDDDSSSSEQNKLKLNTQNSEEPQPARRRSFKPSKLHAFLKEQFFKTKEEERQLETSKRL